jgi:hypothetical protein
MLGLDREDRAKTAVLASTREQQGVLFESLRLVVPDDAISLLWELQKPATHSHERMPQLLGILVD